MQRAREASRHGASGGTPTQGFGDKRADVTDAATTANVALNEMVAAARTARELNRHARAVELFERALAAAEAALPADSLFIASLLNEQIVERLLLSHQRALIGGPPTVDDMMAAWRAETQVVSLSQRMLSSLHARWRAGSLLTRTPHEVFFCGDLREIQANIGAQLYMSAAADAVTWWPPVRTAEEDSVRLHAVRGALVCALDTFFQGVTHATRPLRCELNLPFTAWVSLSNLLQRALCSTAAGGFRERLQSVGLSCAHVAALEHVVPGVLQGLEQCKRAEADTSGARRERAAADVARHGLRACALPECAQTEPHPKAFKLCSRCRGAAYCCAAHQAEDWRRHRRTDGCTAANITTSE
jgi:hypothetical protein